MTLYLNALGIVCALGGDKREVAANLFRGTRAGLVERSDFIPGRTIRVGAVSASLADIPRAWALLDSRNNRLALTALRQIEAEIGSAIGRFGADRIAVVMGTSTSGMSRGEEALAARMKSDAWPNSFTYAQQELGSLGCFVAAALGLSGPAYTIATACSSSAKALASAQRLIEAGFCDAAVVGGVDTLCRLTLNGFSALEAVAPGYCNPFSRNRNGINIGEGGAIFLLSREPSPVALLGVGESSDAYHVSAPDPTGRGARRAMELALEAASLTPGDIDYVNLHGTATPLNDAMEGRAMAALFGSETPCGSTKAMTGHTLGAAGAIEAGFLWLALQPGYANGALPPHLWDEEPDPEIPALRFVFGTTPPAQRQRSAMLSNSFAFGGSNVAVILGRGW
jgi:3-oxoacyl-[acyl-carrier-protein] synthase I